MLYVVQIYYAHCIQANHCSAFFYSHFFSCTLYSDVFVDKCEMKSSEDINILITIELFCLKNVFFWKNLLFEKKVFEYKNKFLKKKSKKQFLFFQKKTKKKLLFETRKFKKKLFFWKKCFFENKFFLKKQFWEKYFHRWHVKILAHNWLRINICA